MAQLLLRLFGYENEALICFVLVMLSYLINLEGCMFVLSRLGLNAGWTNTFIDYSAFVFVLEVAVALIIHLLRRRGAIELRFYSVIW